MFEEILLLSGNDLPFFSAQTVVRQPSIKDISLIGEEKFFIACQLLTFSKDHLSEEDKLSLENMNDFEILMSIIETENSFEQKIIISMLLALLFPDYTINFEEGKIAFKKEEESFIIDKDSFSEFKEILEQMFQLKGSSKEEFNPKNEAARRIAEKIKAGREKIAKMKEQEEGHKISVLSRYVSILGIGLNLDLKVVLDYTIYQLYDQMKRFQLFQAFDMNIKAKLAGATDLDDAENWMDDIYK